MLNNVCEERRGRTRNLFDSIASFSVLSDRLLICNKTRVVILLRYLHCSILHEHGTGKNITTTNDQKITRVYMKDNETKGYIHI